MAANRKSDVDEATDDRSIVTTRVIDAPRELVFEAWTDPRHLASWFGPDGFTITTSRFDLRLGGLWRFVMHGPDGTDYLNLVQFDEIRPPELLRFRHGGEEDFQHIQFKTTVTFEAVGDKTFLTMRGEFSTKAERDRVVREHKAEEGGRQTVGKLAAFVEPRAKAKPTKAKPPLKSAVLVRTFDAPRALVWKAWTDPKQLAEWWGPHGFAAPVCEVDLRPGGRLRIDMQPPGDGPANRVTGEFKDVVEPEKLSFFTRAFEDESGVPQLEGFNTITFAEADGRTTITIEAVILKAADWLAPAMDGMVEGWSQSIDKLTALVGALC